MRTIDYIRKKVTAKQVTDVRKGRETIPEKLLGI